MPYHAKRTYGRLKKFALLLRYTSHRSTTPAGIAQAGKVMKFFVGFTGKEILVLARVIRGYTE